MQMRNVLHPTDFSETATHALKQAVALAATHQATLHVFHAILLLTEDPATTETELRDYAATAESLGQALAKATGAKAPAVQVTSARSVSVFDAVMDQIAELRPDVVVMGTHGRSGLSKFLMGSEAEKLLRHAPCHVLTVRTDASVEGPFFRHLLVPVDLSDNSRRALDVARSLARESNGTVSLLHVVEPIPPMYYAGAVGSRFQLDSELPGRVKEKMREWAGDGQVTVMVTEGSPAAEITKVSDDIGADLIVMGSRGLTGLDHVLMGSVAEKVCRFARTPVLTIK